MFSNVWLLSQEKAHWASLFKAELSEYALF